MESEPKAGGTSPRTGRAKVDNVSAAETAQKSFFHINRGTLPLKITLFLFYGAMSAILPYLTIQMKDIGLSISQIAIIYAVLPITAFLGPPIMGFMADQMGQYKTSLVIATVLTGILHTSLLFVPTYSETPQHAATFIQFRSSGSPVLHPVAPELCDSFKKSLSLPENSLRNRIIRIHSCQATDLSPNIGSRVIGGNSSVNNIPPYCITTDDESDVGDDSKVRRQLFCGDSEESITIADGAEWETEAAPTPSGRTLIQPSPPQCPFRIQFNSEDITTPDNIATITCQTNYTFDSGERKVEGNGPLTFWLYFFLRTIGNIFMNSCFSLLDATTLAVVGSHEGAEYGRERILCTLGFAIVSPLAGLIVDRVSASKGYTDYSAAFYLSNAMLLLNIIGYFFMNLDVEKPNEDFWKDAAQLLNYPEVVVFLGMIFILGNMWGFVESYLFIFLDELHAPKYLLGLTLTVGSLSSIPFLYGAEKLVAKAGRVNIIVLAFLTYFVRFFGYSFIPNPFWCFPFEAMEAVTYHLMWVAAATYCAVLAPKGLLATLTGVMGSLHYGLGKGSGAFIGGAVINVVQTRQSFRYFGIVAGIVGIIYFLINKLWLEGAIRRRSELEKGSAPGLDAKKPGKEQKAMLSSTEV